MHVVFVHGWSVTDTSSYGEFPEALAARSAEYGLTIDIKQVWLGRYISFRDELSAGDVARAFQRALRDEIPEGRGIAEFSCIAHSTGGPVVREWLERFYGAKRLAKCPLRHFIMLAPANHGSALAVLGKQKVGRIRAWASGVEPGQRILDWLSLGSQEQIDLARRYLDYEPARNKLYPFVLTGQTIDRKLYDFINSYLAEKGSDGVVRVAAANLNYNMIELVESGETVQIEHGNLPLKARRLEIKGKARRPTPVALGVIPGASHSGDDKGILRSVVSPKSKKPQLDEVLKCLQVGSMRAYNARADELEKLSRKAQKRSHRYAMLVFVLRDDQGDPVEDFDLVLLGGQEHSPDRLSKGFFVDRQQNASHPNHLVYYVDYDVICKNRLTGFRVVARPAEGFAYYNAVEYRSDKALNQLMRPNETLYVEIELSRCVDANAFRLDSAEDPKLRKKGKLSRAHTRRSFKDQAPKRRPSED